MDSNIQNINVSTFHMSDEIKPQPNPEDIIEPKIEIG